MSKGQKRPFRQIMPIATSIIDNLAPFCTRIQIAGSLRRQREMIGDIEIVALPRRPVDLFQQPIADAPTDLDLFLASRISTFRVNGSKLKSWQHGPVQVDLFLPESEAHWGSIYTIRTGSHEFNMWLMTTAAPAAQVKFDKGLLYDWNRKRIDTPTEADVFKALGLPFIPPTMRDDYKWKELL